MKQAASRPMRFVSTDGYPIYVGRNNRQNDELTMKLAQKNDLWLHVQKLHGSHVIVPWTWRPAARMTPSPRRPNWRSGSPRAVRGRTWRWM